MLGKFTNFPNKAHGWAKIYHVFTSSKIQLFILQSLSDLNEIEEKNAFEFFDTIEKFSTITSFEIGLAEDMFFNYLSHDNVNQYWYILSKREPSEILDFLMILKYHQKNEERLIHLKFDHFLMRFTFSPKTFDLLIFHERGTRRIQIKELLYYILGKINEKVEKKGFKPLVIEQLQAI